MNRLLVLFGLFALGCGGGSHQSAKPQYRPAPSSAPQDAPVAAESADRSWFDFDDSDGEADVADRTVVNLPAPGSAPRKGASKSEYFGPTKPKPKPPRGAKTDAMDKPIVVYLGYLKLRVRRLLEAVDAVTARVEKLGGYVESLSSRVVVVRVPAGDFEAAMGAFAELGSVLARHVKALDVTEKFTDLRGRLVVAKDTRARLLLLLEQVTDTKERLRILQEVKRLTEQIESIESKLTTLQNLVDFYTITIELEPILAGNRQVVHRSPFPWVRGLAAHRTTVDDGKDDLRLSVPQDFVLFDDDDSWRAQAADTTILRAGTVDNEPRGTAEWWASAVEHEMTGRDEELVEKGTAGAMSWAIFRNKDVQPRTWLVGVRPDGEDLFVVEAFFPNEDAFKRHRDSVVKTLDSFRPKG